MTGPRQIVDSWAAEFRAAYDDDARNAVRQSFEAYWEWVRVFLVEGGAGQRGWFDQADDALRRVHDAARAGALRDRLSDLGRRIAAEWAKDSRHRRIHSTAFQGSPNLWDWGRRLQRAAANDGGDGVAIERAIDTIAQDVAAALRA